MALQSNFKIWKAKIQALKSNTVVRFIVLWLTAYAFLLSFYFASILRNYNYQEIFPRELVFPFLLHAITATVLTLAVFWVKRLKFYFGKLSAVVILALMTTGYEMNLQAIAGVIRAFTPGLTDSSLPVVSLVYMLILYAIAILTAMGIERLVAHYPKLRASDVQLGIFVIVGYVFLLPAYSIIRIVPVLVRETNTQATQFTQTKQSAASKNKPDIYYIVLDRYANANTLSEQFNFDNSPFTDYLRSNNFTVKDNAYGNYPYTAMSISSTMNAQYTNTFVAPYKNSEIQTRSLYHNLIWQSSVAKAFKSNGYKYYAIGAWYGASYKAPLADVDYMWEHQLTTFGFKKRLRGMEAIEFMKSPYYRLAQFSASWWPFKVVDHDRISDVRQQLQILRELSTVEKPGGRFIFAHILVPHDPFDFNADGSISTTSGSDDIGQPIKQKYTNQVQFINSKMKELVTNIQKQSNGKAVVLLTSDEGPYPQYLNNTFAQPQAADVESTAGMLKDEDMRTWPQQWLKMKFGVLQAVHIPRATEDDFANMSSVNLFRIVLNRYANYNLPYLPDCHYGITSGMQHEYNYGDITRKFTDNPDPRCTQMQSLPKILRPTSDTIQR